MHLNQMTKTQTILTDVLIIPSGTMGTFLFFKQLIKIRVKQIATWAEKHLCIVLFYIHKNTSSKFDRERQKVGIIQSKKTQ